MPSGRLLACASLAPLLTLGCGHGEPFVAGDPGTRSPFAEASPIRLTYDDGADIHPVWTADGSALMYTFERQLPGSDFPDRCLGALPPDGGQRIREWCWPGWDEGTRRDGIEAGTLGPGGLLVFAHHYGAGTKQPNPFRGEVFVAPAVAIDSPGHLLTLLVQPPGGTARYDYLLSPVFTAPRQVTALAASVDIAERCFNCAFDTVFTGVDLVRLATDQPDHLQVIARVAGAHFLVWDPSIGRFFFARDGRIETVPTGGGEPVMAWQVPRSDDRRDEAITGIAAGAGRLLVSHRWREGEVVHTQLGEILADGSIAEIAAAANGPAWGEMSLSPDGTRLVVERRDPGGARDLYLYRVP